MGIDLMAELDQPEVKPDQKPATVKSEKKQPKKPEPEFSTDESRMVMHDGPAKNESAIPLAGHWVFWFQGGEVRNRPCPALVTLDSGQQRVLTLTVFTVNGLVIKDSVKHVSAEENVRNRELYGGWAWNRDGKGI